jgi:hypothetical protein
MFLDLLPAPQLPKRKKTNRTSCRHADAKRRHAPFTRPGRGQSLASLRLPLQPPVPSSFFAHEQLSLQVDPIDRFQCRRGANCHQYRRRYFSSDPDQHAGWNPNRSQHGPLQEIRCLRAAVFKLLIDPHAGSNAAADAPCPTPDRNEHPASTDAKQSEKIGLTPGSGHVRSIVPLVG